MSNLILHYLIGTSFIKQIFKHTDFHLQFLPYASHMTSSSHDHLTHENYPECCVCDYVCCTAAILV